MTIVPVQSALIEEASSVTLAMYAGIVKYPECQFWGVRNDATMIDAACRTIWLKSERDDISYYLAEAQEEIEREMRHPVGYKWFADERLPYRFPLLAKWGEVVEGGVRATSAIATAEAVSHATDPAVIGPFATTVTDEDEIQVQYPATLVEEEIAINPSDIDISGGNATVYIPRCRMVLPSLVDNDRSGVDYSDTTNFLQTVDVVRVYNDPSTHATLVWPHACTSLDVCTCSCDDYTQDGCIYVRQGRIGALDVLPATYSGGAWAARSTCRCGSPEYVLVNYRAGLEMTRQMQDAIVRLAHAKMPEEPCGCDVVQRLWKRDRNEPGAFTRERVNCPFGTSDGAWAAWRFAQAMKLRRGGGL
jgi:hypothetical protein